MTPAETLRLIGELEELVGRFGTCDYRALRRVVEIAFALMSEGPPDPAFRQKIYSFDAWAGVGLSDHRFETVPGGLEEVKRSALAACSGMSDAIRRLGFHPPVAGWESPARGP